MPYRPNLAKTPNVILALWSGQKVTVGDIDMVLHTVLGTELVFLASGDITGDKYKAAMDRFMNGEVGYTNLAPVYSDFIQHVRQGPRGSALSKAHFTRQGLIDLLLSGEYYIG